MKKIFYSLFVLFLTVGAGSAFADTTAVQKLSEFKCGQGYVLDEQHTKKVDGISTRECKKLWCHDLAKDGAGNVPMGSGNSVKAGYVDVLSEVTGIVDGQNKTIGCYGKRKWCSGEPEGVWNSGTGLYTRPGDDGTTYTVYKKGSCFAWRLEKPNCADGQEAFLRNGTWVCAESNSAGINTVHKSGIRRTGTMRRLR